MTREQTYRFTLGQRVLLERIADDLKCLHVGQIGTIIEHMPAGKVRPELRYWIAFADGRAHACYDSELTPAPEGGRR